tara:strand:+ start:5563 stop:8166 length:2604 start_codon:yes stop_codon:yes gene_type:complete
MFGHGPFSFTAFSDIVSDVTVSATGVAGTTSLGNETVSVGTGVTVSVVGNAARGNEDLGGARHAEYFVPDDSNNPNITVIAYEDSTTVSADGASLGTISSAGGTLTVSASNYENKIISANKPITLQSANNETVGVPTSWAGTSFGFRNTRVGFVLQMRALYGTASVEIFKDGVSTTTLSVGSTATTTQSYSDDTSDPEYTVYSDLPIIIFKSAAVSNTNDNRPAFPATTDFIYGFASGSASAIRVDGYGETAVTIERYASNGTSNTTATISTINGSFATGTDFTGPANRYKAPKAVTAFSIADSDGGEKTSFIPEGCFATEFRLIEAAEFVCFMGAPGTNDRNIEVYNSSGTLVDTIQLATSNTGSDFPTKFQLISSTTTDSNLTPNKKSYALTAGMRFVSEVPVGAIVEGDNANRESNLFGLRNFGGFLTGTAAIAVTGVAATGTLGSVTVIATANISVSATGVEGTATLGNETVAAGATATATGLSASSGLGAESVTGGAVIAPTGNQGVANAGSMIISGAAVTGVTGTASTSGLGDESVVGTANVSVTGVSGTAAVGNETVSISVSLVPSGVEATASVGNETAVGTATVSASGVEATSTLGNETVTGSATVSPSGVEATSAVGDETITGTATVSPTGAEGTATLGNETVTTDVEVSATGASATTILGDETVEVGITALPAGVAATGQIGDALAAGGAIVQEEGLVGTIGFGDEQVTGTANVSPSGVTATGEISDATILGTANVVPDASGATSALGDVTVVVSIDAAVTGLSANALTNDVQEVTGTATVIPLGLSVTADLGNVNIWGDIIPDQSANWSEVSPDQSASWSGLTPDQSANWSETTPSQGASWSGITPNQSADWKEVA